MKNKNGKFFGCIVNWILVKCMPRISLIFHLDPFFVAILVKYEKGDWRKVVLLGGVYKKVKG